jgi:hypothetical protein
MFAHIIRQGEYLSRLAWQHGFDEQAIWSHPQNAALADLRKDHAVLAPGDIIYLPEPKPRRLPLKVGQNNVYVAVVPTVELKMRFVTGCGRFAGAKYVVRGVPSPMEGALSGEGDLDIRVPITAREVVVAFPELDEQYQLLVGNLDPATERTGVRQRLTQLGYLLPAAEDFFGYDFGWVDPYAEQRLDEAIRSFQSANNLPITGVADAHTQQALLDTHGV